MQQVGDFGLSKLKHATFLTAKSGRGTVQSPPRRQRKERKITFLLCLSALLRDSFSKSIHIIVIPYSLYVVPCAMCINLTFIICSLSGWLLKFFEMNGRMKSKHQVLFYVFSSHTQPVDT